MSDETQRVIAEIETICELKGRAAVAAVHMPIANVRLIASELSRLRKEVADLREAAVWAINTLQEINIGNYDHDDVCALNAASVEVILGLAALTEGEQG